MNVAVDYDDEVERRATHPQLLPKSKDVVPGNVGIQQSHSPSRSVLGKDRPEPQPGLLRKPGSSANDANGVTWRDVVVGLAELTKGNHYS